MGSAPVSNHEKIISALGGFIGIYSIIYISTLFVGAEEMVYIVTSMGASAVLLFAVPHSALGQLWNVIGGHLISAAIGVACYQWLPSNGIAAGASVGLAIGAMYYTRCIHPPGGATALAAV
ncbi:MAG TPA: HPP domain-containing protein, partial [Deltaproteobacteria bacterium]|nr:HPP domain-containing protein [Deltaproteobacteria bacterium]